MTDKFNQIGEILKLRDQNRKLQIQKRKEAKEEENSFENVSSFTKEFNLIVQEVQNLLNNQEIKSKNDIEKKEIIETISNKIQEMKKFLSESIVFLPNYDQKKAQQNKIKDSEFSFQFLESQTIWKYPGTINGKDFSLSNLKNCTIFLCDKISALWIDNIESCKIYTGPISGSIFLENCIDSTFMLAAQQIRLHSSNNCDLYIFTKSEPIIEDCKEIRVAPYSFDFPGIDSLLSDLQMNDQTQNLWNQIKDFNWIKTEKSPNWEIIPNQNRENKKISKLK
ncbi:tubulin folding cofactor c [Anaeramoeba ignava]|uniref:Tubulin folding cofactor c n=1 Tax=Anaeramoeba ignava TaxID=1746090 RepID=A0A9Q0R8M4_ANAIG|nr:tubulin folding cofactor c [Anaeramoeba ignava]